MFFILNLYFLLLCFIGMLYPNKLENCLFTVFKSRNQIINEISIIYCLKTVYFCSCRWFVYLMWKSQKELNLIFGWWCGTAQHNTWIGQVFARTLSITLSSTLYFMLCRVFVLLHCVLLKGGFILYLALCLYHCCFLESRCPINSSWMIH